MPYLGIFYVFSFLGVYLKGFVLFVSPLIGCTGRSILHCEFSIFFIVSRASHCPCAHSMASATSASFTEQPLQIQKPLHAEHAHVPNIWCRDGAWKVWGLTLHFYAVSFSSRFLLDRYCNEHLLCPPHVFWTGWGPWERCTAQCGGGIQARRRTCENGPDCAGCNVVSRVLLIPSPQPGPGRAEWAHTRCFPTQIRWAHKIHCKHSVPCKH